MTSHFPQNKLTFCNTAADAEVANSESLSLQEIQVPASLWSYFHQPSQHRTFFFYVFLLKDPYFILLTHWHSLMANGSVSHTGMKLNEDKTRAQKTLGWIVGSSAEQA